MAQVFRSLADAAAAELGPCALTIGNFDGVHLGHRRILETAVARARRHDWRAAALTFDPHPARVVAPDRAPELMTTIEQRLELFAALGVDAVVIMPFTPELARLSPEEFVRDVLVERLGVRRVVVGANFRFGHRHAGDIDAMEALGRRYGFCCEAVEPVLRGGDVVSSSRVRTALAAGRLREARRLLGGVPRVRGRVVPGRGIGGRQTVPTLNVEPDADLTLADGVYVSQTRDLDSDRCWRSVTNVGIRPTFGGGARTVETHLLDELERDTPIRIEVCFHRRLRAEKTFRAASELKRQILADIDAAQRFFRLRARLTRQGSG